MASTHRTLRRGLARAAAALVLGAALLGSPALEAHHSFAPFDMDSEKTITGTVKEFDWTNPHTWIWLNVTNDQGGVDVWGVEGMSPNYLARRGWNKNTLKFGDKVTVVVRPMKDGSKAGMFVRATLADGKPLRMSGEPTQ